MALTCIDGKRYDEAKQYIVGALQIFDEQNKVSKETESLVRRQKRGSSKLRKNQK